MDSYNNYIGKKEEKYIDKEYKHSSQEIFANTYACHTMHATYVLPHIMHASIYKTRVP